MNIAISKDGTRIAYEKTGKGPAVVLVTGAFSYRSFPDQVELARLLSDRYTVYYYDRRGRGDSGDAAVYAPQREVEDLEAVLAAAGEAACVWALSSGAMIALRAAAGGADIAKLALHEPPFIVGEQDRRPPADFEEQTRRIAAAGDRAEAVRYFMTEGLGAPAFVVKMMRMMPGVWKKLLAVAHTLPYDAELMSGWMDGKPLRADDWSAVTTETLVLAGTESPAALRRGAEAIAAALPSAALCSAKGLGHTKKLQPKRIAAELNAFFG
ncbi:alpha/beta fold hydrolase [Paenibacillus pasadenensis]|uniref:alpha/beta fold hydrolase n=1 Tax=Paenibacillus pasadenensis TaxID=217090 RepID=UPI0004080790|nr:alpha/beta hydrolase [Paenibacillus pasadenensis]